MNFQIPIPTDSEGFYSLRCPHCKGRFKAQAGDIDAEETIDLFCPSCGLMAESSNFTPPEIIEHATIIVKNYAQEQMFKAFKQSSKKLKGSGIKIKVTKPKEELPKILTEDENLEEITLICCDKTIKLDLDQIASVVYCPYCGVN
ncbi:hypothetical protein [Metabacillus hrfriensis]|uniref:Uncharacterized protein n=1 Tax=Metabacillus hrfriensis TaxID=3048891 RepID=A0ACD4RE27_9BACI|nr:hypothetical protein [Metabacillus sp. CT-WN-B3]WHZ58775.1 hypothetical protein QLQ22_05395 [Metabacillus sp. CT-WN-B3]